MSLIFDKFIKRTEAEIGNVICYKDSYEPDCHFESFMVDQAWKNYFSTYPDSEWALFKYRDGDEYEGEITAGWWWVKCDNELQAVRLEAAESGGLYICEPYEPDFGGFQMQDTVFIEPIVPCSKRIT